MSVANAFERDIHRRLLAGDRTASIDLAEAYLAPVRSGVRRRIRWVRDETLLDDTATDALLKYAEQPARYDPDRMALLPYLVMDAYRDLLNALERERRRTTRLRTLDVVEFGEPARNTAQEDTEAEVVNRLSAEDDPCRQELLRRLFEVFPDPQDWRMLALVVNRERKTEAFARILGIENRPVAEQRKVVKRHKDRIIKRLERLGVKFRDQETN